VKPTEAAALLTIAAAYDNRKPDADQAKAWSMALNGLRFEDCRAVVVEHYQRSKEWLMPADVITGVKRIRDKRIAEYGPIDVPSGLGEAEYRAYLRETQKRIGDGELTSQSRPQIHGKPRDMRAIEGTFRTVDEEPA
jgi:hypothetical protein